MPGLTIYTVAAKSEGEVLAHCLVRTEFRRRVLADDRTRFLFEFWGGLFGIDAVVADVAALLDDVAFNAGLDHRSLLKTVDLQDHAPMPVARQLLLYEVRIRQLLAESRDERQRLLADVLVRLLGSRYRSMHAWLSADLMDDFEAEVWSQVWGDTGRIIVPLAPTLTPVPKGQRPKGDGAHLLLYASWLYRARLAVPRVSIHALADEYRAASPGSEERPDTKLVRHGIAEATRLLSLTIPPEEWAHYRTIH